MVTEDELVDNSSIEKFNIGVESFQTFDLSNNVRKYFALNDIEPKWDTVFLNERMTLYFDGNIIKKVVKKELRRSEDGIIAFYFYEYDTNIQTIDRRLIIPKTDRGKLKSITTSNIEAIMPNGSVINFAYNSTGFGFNCYNPNNNQKLPIPAKSYKHISSVSDLNNFIDDYMRTCPDDYFEKVDRVKNSPHKTVKYKVGDLFRMEIDRSIYGYGLIIGKVRDLTKWVELSDEHPLRHTMTQPLLIRLYKIMTTDKDLKECDLSTYDILPTIIVSDNDIIWGTHPIIDRKQLIETDIDFPVHYTHTIDARIREIKYYLAWGFGLKSLALPLIPNKLKTGQFWEMRFSNTGVKSCIPTCPIEKAMAGEYPSYLGDLNHPDNIEIKKDIFKLYNVNENIDFDTFNLENNGLTKRQYIEILYSRK